ncbi:MAG: hypothetical protein ACYC6G_15310 [Desulfobaccales bacterium]
MKKWWLTLGLALMLTAGGGQGFHGFGAGPACGQPPPYVPPPYNNPYYYPPPYNYYNYYSAPYSDPLSQFLYYVAPQVGREGAYEEWEHRGREGYEHRGHGRGHD